MAKSEAALVTGREPKRERGRLRVAAITATAVEVFREKGFDAATMTEIAERSGTAIASLYRFFPSKEALAEELLGQYRNYVLAGLSELRDRASGMSADQLAQALIDFRLALLSQRRFALSLTDAPGVNHDSRAEFRQEMLASLAAVLRKAMPALAKAKAEAMAHVLVHVLKGVSEVDQEMPAMRRPYLAEIRNLLRTYFAATADWT